MLTQLDISKIRELEKIRGFNFDVLNLLSSYLNNSPCFITKEMVDGLVGDCGISTTDAFVALLLAACGLDSEVNTRHALLENNYIVPAVARLNPLDYTANAYYQNIKIDTIKFNCWEFSYQSYKPYEAFVYNDIVVNDDFSEVPRIGFFEERFNFPSVLQNGTEWMAIKPNEIETMQPAIDAVSGNVVTFGLGLGYFAYMVSQKPNVNSITIVETDTDVISLFRKYILPQFAHAAKVKIVRSDAFEYVKNQMPKQKFDFAFVDLWHDVSDGFGMYLKMKKLECTCSETKFLYWIEDSLLSHLRWLLFDEILDFVDGKKPLPNSSNLKSISTFAQVEHYLSSQFLRKLAARI